MGDQVLVPKWVESLKQHVYVPAPPGGFNADLDIELHDGQGEQLAAIVVGQKGSDRAASGAPAPFTPSATAAAPSTPTASQEPAILKVPQPPTSWTTKQKEKVKAF